MTGGPQWIPLAGSQQAYETGVPPSTGTTTEIRAGENVAAPLRYNPTYPYAPETTVSGGVTAVAVGAPPRLEPERVPLTREIDDFSRGFNDALEKIGEEDPADEANATNMTNTGNGEASTSEERPLWQQNRRQSRNLMWM